MDPDVALELALSGDFEALQALDQWLRSGGFLPRAWKRDLRIDIVRRALATNEACCLDDESDMASVCESIQALVRRL